MMILSVGHKEMMMMMVIKSMMMMMMMVMMILIVVNTLRENCQQHVSVVSSLVELSTLTEFFLPDKFKLENKHKHKVKHTQKSQTQTTKLEVIQKFCPHCGSIVIISVSIIIMIVIEVPNIGESKAAPFDMRAE